MKKKENRYYIFDRDAKGFLVKGGQLRTIDIKNAYAYTERSSHQMARDNKDYERVGKNDTTRIDALLGNDSCVGERVPISDKVAGRMAEKSEDKVLIVEMKEKKFWAAPKKGITSNINEAHEYSKREALEILEKDNGNGNIKLLEADGLGALVARIDSEGFWKTIEKIEKGAEVGSVCICGECEDDEEPKKKIDWKKIGSDVFHGIVMGAIFIWAIAIFK